jgi:CheY-like chemotaxis protein
VWWLRLGIEIERIQPGHTQQNGCHERLHLTLKREATKPAAANVLQQQARSGHEVRTVHDGVEALAVARTFKPHIVVLDRGMPKMDGYETAQKLRLHSWGTRATLIALTGWGQQQDRQRTTEAGFDAHLVKPVSESQLFQTLASAGRKKPTGDVAETG